MQNASPQCDQSAPQASSDTLARGGIAHRVTGVLSLFTSTGTLLCCALPAALGAIAGGAAVSSMVSAFPWLVPLSRHKIWLFIGAGIMIVFTGFITYRPKGQVACSITGGRGCEDASRFAKVMFWVSLSVYAIGAFMAYAIVPILRLFSS